jgi:dolichyl-phosphate-mannose--protein O-mannosyl transferase
MSHGAQTHSSPSISSPESAVTVAVAASLRRWTQLDTQIMLLAIVCALALYFFRLDRPTRYIYDEVYHAYSAAKLAAGIRDPYMFNTQVPPEDKKVYKVSYEWSHPALAKPLMEVGIWLFGDNSFGWRFSSAIFGALGIGVMYALGRTLFDRTVALFGAGLLLFDGLWFVQSRTAMNDVFLVCFLMLAYLAFYRYLTSAYERRWGWLAATGVALGLAVATKWSALYSIGLIGLTAGLRELKLGLPMLRRSPLAGALTLVNVMRGLLVLLILVPAALYIGGYFQFFWMGYTLKDWGDLQYQMWWYHSNLKACHDWASPWWTWPLLIKPVWYHVARNQDGTIENVFAMGNPLIWWPFLPAMCFAAYAWVRGRFQSIALGLVLLGFFGQWLPWALSPRISYFYHMLPSVPFACLAIGYALQQIGRQGRTGQRLVLGYLALVCVTFLFFYSHYTALPVSATYTNLHYWLPTWIPGSAWPYKCPSATFTLLDLLGR